MTRQKTTGGRKPTKSAQRFTSDMTADVLARTLWGEARGEGKTGMQAVANVILNRVEVAAIYGGYWWGNDVLNVCIKPYQFSCWNKNDPNYAKLLSVDVSEPAFKMACDLANTALRGILPDITSNATHYHAPTVAPDWAQGRAPTAIIGQHKFFRIVDEENVR